MGLKLCLHPGCMAATFGPRCPAHEALWQAARNDQPTRRLRRRQNAGTVATGICTCCGATEDITRHHVVPLARGQAVTVSTIPMCRSCNSSIGANVMADHRCPKHGGVKA